MSAYQSNQDTHTQQAPGVFERNTRKRLVVGLAHIIVWGLFFTAGVSFAEDPPVSERVVPEIRALRINPHPPIIDGELDDPIWGSPKISYANTFTQREPDEGQAATESTLVAVVYDDEAINFAFWCYDSEPDKVTGQLVRRDRSAESDKVSVRLDPYHDHQTGYLFDLSAAGVQRDCSIYNDDHLDYSWDGIWSSAVKRQPWGWSAEMRIPYHCLRFTEQGEHTWGVDFVRVINRKTEWDRWAFTPSSESGFASNFGHLTGLHGITPARHLAVLPYAVSSLESEPKSDGNPDGRTFPSNIGFDVKYGLSSNLILDAAINPDFGQVELDQPVLNLSTYETFYSERRPFFVEGANLFRTDYRLFYSRRIGRSPGWVDDESLDYYVDRPKATTILGATKLTGKLGGKTSFAFLNAVTQEEIAEYVDTLGNSQEGTIEPLANYSVLRIQQDVLSQSNIGGMFTLASQDAEHPAVTGGADWRLFTNNGMWCASGQAVFSRVDNENVGFGLNAELQKAAGKHIRGSMGLEIRDPHLDLNRLGYLSRNDWRHGWLWMQYRTQDDWWIVRNSWNNINFYTSWNYEGYNIQKGANFNTYIEFINYWSLGAGISVQGEKYSDLETRGNGIWEWPVYPTFAWWASLDTDQRKPISFNFNPGSGTDRGGHWWANYVGVEFRPKSNMEFEIGANYHRTLRGTRWVDNPDDTTAVFADMNKDEVFLHASASVMFHRNLSCQLSATGLIAGLDYRGYRPYLGQGHYGAVYDADEDYNEDYNFSALNSTLLIRWEYLPGSTLYLVWTRSQSESDDTVNDLNLKRDLDRLFSGDAENVFLVKASYWLNI